MSIGVGPLAAPGRIWVRHCLHAVSGSYCDFSAGRRSSVGSPASGVSHQQQHAFCGGCAEITFGTNTQALWPRYTQAFTQGRFYRVFSRLDTKDGNRKQAQAARQHGAADYAGTPLQKDGRSGLEGTDTGLPSQHLLSGAGELKQATRVFSCRAGVPACPWCLVRLLARSGAAMGANSGAAQAGCCRRFRTMQCLIADAGQRCC